MAATQARSRRSRPAACGLACALALAALRPAWPSAAWVPPVATGHREAGRRAALSLAGFAAAASHVDPSEASGLYTTDKFDGSYVDDNFPDELCARTINAQGGFGNVRGRDSAKGDVWSGFCEYQDKKIFATVSYGEESGIPDKLLKGTWFSKKGEKGIKWDDGTVWNKLEYKIVMTPFQEEQQAEQERARMRAEKKIADATVVDYRSRA